MPIPGHPFSGLLRVSQAVTHLCLPSSPLTFRLLGKLRAPVALSQVKSKQDVHVRLRVKGPIKVCLTPRKKV